MGRRFDTVSFLSDLGTESGTIGVVRAIVREHAPHAVVIDLGHGIAPYDVRAGSLALARSIGYVPSGVVIAAVDAGPARRHVALEVAGGEGVLVGPDNGLLAPAVAMVGGAERAVVLDVVTHHLVSPGGPLPVRDIYAPVAALLCTGIELTDLGSPVDIDALLPGVLPLPRDDDGALVADVLWVNHLGDCQLNVGPDEVGAPSRGARFEVRAGEVVRVAEWVDHADQLVPGALGLTVDPYGMVAVVLARRAAADELSVGPGEQVSVRRVEGAGVGAQPVVIRPPDAS